LNFLLTVFDEKEDLIKSSPGPTRPKASDTIRKENAMNRATKHNPRKEKQERRGAVVVGTGE
jgi:hypothetical protein